MNREEQLIKKVYKYRNLMENCDHALQLVEYEAIIFRLEEELRKLSESVKILEVKNEFNYRQN
mgnify:CR=1 FL=1|jgi:hypothetical protein